MAPAAVRVLVNTVLPVLVFPTIAVVAANVIFGQLFSSGAALHMAQQCDPLHPSYSAGLNALSFTGVPGIDGKLCGLVTFFHALLIPDNLPFNLELFSTLAVISVIPFIEAARNGRSLPLALPAVVGILFQLGTVGVIYPVYWFIFLISGAAFKSQTSSKTKAGRKPAGWVDTTINYSHAQAILFSVFVGYIIPTVGMFVLNDPYVTAIWQPFPVWMSLAQFVHRQFSRGTESGHDIVRNTYFLLFLASFTAHSFYIWPLMLNDHETLQHLFTPTLIRSAAEAKLFSFEDSVLNFILWDAGFAAISTLVASFWLAASFTQLLALAVWWVVAPLAFGPGAAIAGVFMWRENVLNGGAEAEEKVKVD
ncbi:hypothetical protein PLICRDRAFT_53437 [Plicaturopsis crispa FD-325 SS-3]|nr:hypothetical protein PLICRDRAFT_53437 [Plicaturopsis crispa FD-325 SS-3]